MKTLEIKGILKKDILIVELPRKSDVEIFPNSVEIYNQFTGQEESIKGFYTLLGKPDEIREEDAKELVEQSIHTGLFAYYVKEISVNTYCYKTAIESFNSALESEIYWDVNPFKKPDNYNLWVKYGDLSQYGVRLTTDNSRWHEAQEKTFDRNRTLIFVKN